MTKLRATFLAAMLLSVNAAVADTFENHQTGQVFHGYVTSRTEEDGRAIVHTREKGVLGLNLTEWDITADRLGRNNKVIILTIDKPIEYEIETAALEEAIIECADAGPLFILLEIDTPGGRQDLTYRICGAITKITDCPVIGFVKTGEYGAISAGAAVALACDKIYMAENTAIGAAATITVSETGRPEDVKEAYGEVVGEKFSSFWRARLASLAEKNGRSGLIARAMADKDIEVIEVGHSGQRRFVTPVNKKAGQQIIRTWSEKGSLLTLTAAEAVKCGIADELVNSRSRLLVDMDAAGAEVFVNEAIADAGRELKRAEGQLARIRKSLDFKMRQSKTSMPVPKILQILRDAENEFKALIRLARKYPDLQLDREQLENNLNSVKAEIQKIKLETGRKGRQRR